MPHLAPLNWALASIIFWVILLSITTILWWQQSPNLPVPSENPSQRHFTQPWNWS